MRRAFISLVIGSMVLAGCGGSEEPQQATSTRGELQIALPEQISGLRVVREDVAADVERVQETYLDSIGLFSFRETDDLLRASLQIGRFSPVAEVEETRRFRNEIIGRLGSTTPRELRMGETPIWLTVGNEQNVFAWFEEEGFFVLSVRADYPFPRTLLRKLVTAEIFA